jgi:hypothetical protein
MAADLSPSNLARRPSRWTIAARRQAFATLYARFRPRFMDAQGLRQAPNVIDEGGDRGTAAPLAMRHHVEVSPGQIEA